MTAANLFLDEILSGNWPRPSGAQVRRLRVSLHGSLAFTGVGHASDRAVILGLAGYRAETIDPDEMDGALAAIEASQLVRPHGHDAYRFDRATDLIFDKQNALPEHPNGMTFMALDGEDRVLLKREYFSIGGGFVVTKEDFARKIIEPGRPAAQDVPYPFADASQMLEMAGQSGLTIADMKRRNELAHGQSDLDERLDAIWQAMDASIERGMNAHGILPGGLKVRRRAAAMAEKLSAERGLNTHNPMSANEWLSVYAMAVNEENAAGGRVVTAPTNGAAGVVPAVLKYLTAIVGRNDPATIRTYLLTSAAIGGLIKTNASISGAEVGCQGEVGSAAAMAAAGFAAVMGATPNQIENAAEIALEHHLGMTCDPVAGLVQVPCIERNGIAAVKAVTAASLAMRGDGEHIVSLDACIETMRQTGADMDSRYKETSQAGLAVNVVAC